MCRTLIGGLVLPFGRDAVNIFYIPSWLDWPGLISCVGHSLRGYLTPLQRCSQQLTGLSWLTCHSNQSCKWEDMGGGKVNWIFQRETEILWKRGVEDGIKKMAKREIESKNTMKDKDGRKEKYDRKEKKKKFIRKRAKRQWKRGKMEQNIMLKRGREIKTV